MSVSRKRVGILAFEDVEVLDLCGPFEVFSIATERGERGAAPLFNVEIVAEVVAPVRCKGGLRVIPDRAFSEEDRFDVVVVPGGSGVRQQIDRPGVLNWIFSQSNRSGILTGVCTGTALMARAGVLEGRKVTTHWSGIEWLRNEFPDLDVDASARVVDTGTIVTSAGVSAGIDMALHVVGRLEGEDVAASGARMMQYDCYRSPELDPIIVVSEV